MILSFTLDFNEIAQAIKEWVERNNPDAVATRCSLLGTPGGSHVAVVAWEPRLGPGDVAGHAEAMIEQERRRRESEEQRKEEERVDRLIGEFPDDDDPSGPIPDDGGGLDGPHPPV